jgi:hypothetical protein
LSLTAHRSLLIAGVNVAGDAVQSERRVQFGDDLAEKSESSPFSACSTLAFEEFEVVVNDGASVRLDQLNPI